MNLKNFDNSLKMYGENIVTVSGTGFNVSDYLGFR